MYTNTLPKGTENVLNTIAPIQYLQQFYLSGGTALALQIGHRESEDLDFFTQKNFSPQLLEEQLSKMRPLESTQREKGTLNTYFEKIKLQFLYYPYRLLEQPFQWNGIFVSAVIDIACTKLITVSDRGSKKDFIDLFVILKQMTLAELFNKLEEKYKDIHYNQTHILKSLVYFDDAEGQPMPRLHIPLEWDDVKNTIMQKVQEYQF